MPDLLPLFLTLAGRDVVLVGGGHVAAAKLRALVAAGARVRVVAPVVEAQIERAGVEIIGRGFVPADLDGAWLVVAAATPEVNREVAAAAEPRRIFVNAVDDPANASAFLSGTIRRDGVTIAVSTRGDAPALTALVREALDALLPADLDRWLAEARRQRTVWRRDQVPMDARKPRLLQALNRLYTNSPAEAGHYDVNTSTAEHAEHAEHMKVVSASSAVSTVNRDRAPVGHVSLVGAGPGDPALLTRRAIARLRAADLVLYDALIDDRILRYARNAQRFFVGKRGGGPGGDAPRPIDAPAKAISQQTIQTVMVRAARRGRRVVRLKGGDPFVFGRGGEEALALRQAGVPFDVVPGVSSAIAAPGLAGIPVTHRGVSAALLVVSGHDDEGFRSAVGNLQPHGGTLVVLMGAGRCAAIATALVEHGWSRDTPAAIVAHASAADQQVWRGTLEEMLDGSSGSKGSRGSRGSDPPATIVVGDVVALASMIQDADDSQDAAPGLERKYVTGT